MSLKAALNYASYARLIGTKDEVEGLHSTLAFRLQNLY